MKNVGTDLVFELFYLGGVIVCLYVGCVVVLHVWPKPRQAHFRHLHCSAEAMDLYPVHTSPCRHHTSGSVREWVCAVREPAPCPSAAVVL